jgi:hypothetical protein
MNKNISTQFFLEQDFGGDQKIMLESSRIKKDILDAYNLACETFPKSKFRVIREETLTEVIAESEDFRQTLLPFS